MKVFRFPENPLIAPDDVKPFHRGHEVIGVFNAGVAQLNGEVLLLLRVAERPCLYRSKCRENFLYRFFFRKRKAERDGIAKK
ncbi:putative GH43/DUF377 family glycosyl hydrolase [Aeribacillus sp. SP014]